MFFFLLKGCIRFTPTRVGITRVSVNPARLVAVHPHARGDHKMQLPKE